MESHRHCNRCGSPSLWGQMANIPLTVAFRNCRYCSSSDHNVLYEIRFLQEPQVSSFLVTDELDPPLM